MILSFTCSIGVVFVTFHRSTSQDTAKCDLDRSFSLPTLKSISQD